MRRGDLAFFYHSNTKVPGVAGIMEIVEEHSIDGMPQQREHVNVAKLTF
jgi:predicted RNA-binding protein with PUA-like domain